MKKNNDLPIIIACLKQVMLESGYSNFVVNAAIKKAGVEDQDARHIRKVVYGTIENWLYLEAWLTRLADKRMKQEVKLLLMAGLYEVAFLKGMPDHVVVNRYVDYTQKHYSFAKGFVNAVLRRGYREPMSLEGLKPAEALALKYSHPQWLVGKWVKRFGLEETEALLVANLKERPLSLRVNGAYFEAQGVSKALEGEGLRVGPSPILTNALVVDHMGGMGLENLKAFKEGQFIVQDISSMLVGAVMGLVAKPHQKWLDLCSAPGGKATDMAERLYPSGEVVACDIHDQKLGLIKENAQRLRLGNIQVVKNDATEEAPHFTQGFDGVLVDAPCSGLGIIGRKPEIKYRKQPDDITALVGLQKRILDLASGYVKAGGYLIYSTCTILSEENEGQIQAFLETHPEFHLVSIQEVLPEQLRNQEAYIKLSQSNGWSDGFFIAMLVKR